MKSNAFKNQFGILSAVCLLSFVGCTTDLYNPEPTPTPPPGPTDNTVFDFATEKSFTLNVDYDVPEGYKVSFEVYTEDPITVSEFGQMSKKDIKPIDVGTTDEQGNYSYKIARVPAMVDQLYIYSSNIGVPRLMVAKVNGDQLEDAKVPDFTEETKAMVLRDASDYENKAYNKFADFNVDPHKLGYWMNANRKYGRPGYLYKDVLNVDKSILEWLTGVVPDGKNNQVHHHLDDYLVSGDIKVVENSEIWLYFIDEGTGAYSPMGYYCYETENPPKSASEIEKRTVIAFPHAKKIGNDYGALNIGEGVQLNYIDADGKNKGTAFPEGTSIGWVIYNNGYKDAAKSGKRLTAKGNGDTPSVIYSTPSLRPDKNTPQVALFRKDKFVALTMEDWYSGTDWDYNDVIFAVNANPIQAILPDVPEAPDPEQPEAPAAAEYEGILAFEDLWPRQGDFDMNDVVVHYKTKITYNDKNEVTKTEDVFTLRWTGATIQNGFGYMLKASSDNVTIAANPGVQILRDATTGNTIVKLFNDVISETANNTKTPEITITTTFKKPIGKNDFDFAPYNPYIMSSSMDREVHLTNNVPTSFAKAQLFGTADDESVYGQGKYYVTHQRDAEGNFTAQQMPFAIHMLGLGKDKFVIPAESRRIDTFYPKFLNWVNTKGQEDADWFNHPDVKK